MPGKYTVVLADDHQIVRDGLRVALESPGLVEPSGLEVVAEAANGFEALAEVKLHKPHVLILDVSMPLAGGAEVIADIRRWSPKTAIVILTGVTAPGMLSALVDSGVNGLFSKGESLEELYKKLPVILRGGNYIADSMMTALSTNQSLQSLTERERQTLNMIIAGKTSREIAEQMSVSIKTVDKHRTSLMSKLQVHSVAELMAKALKLGLIDPADFS